MFSDGTRRKICHSNSVPQRNFFSIKTFFIGYLEREREYVVWTAVHGVNSCTWCEQRYTVWTAVRGVNSCTWCEQRYVVWTAVRGVNSGKRCEQRYAVWTAVHGVNSGTWREQRYAVGRWAQVCSSEQLQVWRYNIYGTVKPLAALYNSFNKHALCSHTCVISMVPWSRSLPFIILSINTHCAPTRVSYLCYREAARCPL